MAGFAESIRLNIVRVQREIDAKCFAIFQDLATTVIYKCPVLRGNLINDFWPASNAYNLTCKTVVDADFQSLKGSNSDVTGSGSISRIRDMQGIGTFFQQDGFMSFSTSVNYAYRIEYEGWSKIKAPSGFIRNSLTAVAAKYR
jgi:hypothetical protein